MGYGHIALRIFAPVVNLFTGAVNLVIRRDRKVLLFGSWMGDRYADNSRFLYQYLQENKELYDIDKLVWVTRSDEIYDELKSRGCEVYMMNSLKSLYYHFKAGVHVVCNMSHPVKGYKGDIMGQFSGKAVKINMWHGIPLKAGKSTGENVKKSGIKGRIKHFLRNNRLFNALFTPGHWDKAYYFSTGRECTRLLSMFCGVPEEQFIECGYPRDIELSNPLDGEKAVIEQLKAKDKVILYVPTFREGGEVPHPLSDASVREFIEKNGCLWVEKPHSAAKDAVKLEGLGEHVLYLDGSFDINTVLPYISVLLTDYSSVCFDAFAYDKPVLYYAPDYKHYATKERGFITDYKGMVRGYGARDTEGLVAKLARFFDEESYRKLAVSKAAREKKRTMEAQPDNFEELMDKLNERVMIAERKASR